LFTGQRARYAPRSISTVPELTRSLSLLARLAC